MAALAGLLPSCGHAHASEQTLVLLLPTDFYIATGVAAVALTVILLAVIPARLSAAIFSSIRLSELPDLESAERICSLMGSIAFFALIFAGFTGPQNPLVNPLPLAVWTIWWMGILFLHGAVGNLWNWINPWTGLCQLLTANRQPPFRLPDRLGTWPAVLGLVAFGAFALADPSPDAPDRLAVVALSYWVMTLFGMLLFGADTWRDRCECFSVLFGMLASLAPLRRQQGESRIGMPGWSARQAGAGSTSRAIFALTALATGSFDGLNETFWWLNRIGVNPLEFPGRSAVMLPTIGGLVGAVLILSICFSICVLLGMRLVNGDKDGPTFAAAFQKLAISVLPIALGYHFAHFLIAFMVNIQYVAVSASDPFGTGGDLLGLGSHFVSTGFLKSIESVRVIWLTQCAAIVLGHVLAVLLAHAAAVDLFGHRRAAISQIPMALLMIAYTLLSLWLLASPRGA